MHVAGIPISGCFMKRFAIVALGLLLAVGCNSSKVSKATLSGAIAYKGQAVNGGALRLISTSGGTEVVIPLAQDGTFRSADVPAGDYKVVVEPSEGFKGPPAKGMTPEMQAKMKANPDFNQAGTIPIPEKYKKKETSDLTITVNKSGETKVNLELKD
jgi:hypothetical protein